jgi:hypothetical protein
LQPALQVGEVAYRTTRAVKPFALLAERLAACPLFDVLGRDAIAGLAIAVVVVDLGVGRVPSPLKAPVVSLMRSEAEPTIPLSLSADMCSSSHRLRLPDM